MSKQLFVTIRKLLGRPLTQADVDAVNASLTACTKPDAPSAPERNGAPGKIGREGIALIKSFEGCHKKLPDGRIAVYPDPGSGGVPFTLGWGSTRGLDGRPFVMGQSFTQAEVDTLLERDLKKYADEVAMALGPSLARTSQRQFDALVSFHYNTGAIARATLTAKHRAGDFKGAAAEFAKWVKAAGKTMKGLVRRRAAERDLYASGS